MRNNRQKQLMKTILLGVVAVVIFGTVAYWLAGYVQVKQARQHYRGILDSSDEEAISRFKAADMEEVKRLVAVAEKSNLFLRWPQICENYRAAAEKLQGVQSGALEIKNEYDWNAQRYERLYSEAVEANIEKHVPEVWNALQQLVLTKPGQHDFDPQLNLEQLQIGIEFLSEARKTYSELRTYDEAWNLFNEKWKQVQIIEWRQNIPEQLEIVEQQLAGAQAFVEKRQWNSAAQLYNRLRLIIAQEENKIGQRRDEALKALADLMKHVNAAEKELKQFAAQAWVQVVEIVKTAEKHHEQCEYRQVGEMANVGVQLITSTSEKVKKAKEIRDKQIAQLQAGYLLATEKTIFYQRNWPEAWTAILDEYNQISALVTTGSDYVLQVEKATALSARLKELQLEGDKLQHRADGARATFEKLAREAKGDLIMKNLPELAVQLRKTNADATTNWTQQNLAAASEAYEAASALLEKSAETLIGLQKKAAVLRAENGTRAELFKKGMEVFHPAAGGKLSELREQAEQNWKLDNWRLAIPIYEEMDHIVPTSRFVIGADGVVSDYENGYMWLRPASTGDEKDVRLDWYQALTWAAERQGVTFENWRLPSEQELLTLAKLNKSELEKLFPEGSKETYWSQTQIVNDVTKVFVCDFGLGRSRIVDKKSLHRAIAVRIPNAK